MKRTLRVYNFDIEFDIDDYKLPELSGSEKQIAWASDIRESAFAYLAVEKAAAESESGTSGPTGRKISVGAVEKAIETLMKEMQTVTSAAKIIEHRQRIHPDKIGRICEDLTAAGI